MTQPYLPDPITASELAEMCGCSSATVHRWIKARGLRASRSPGGHWRIYRRHVREWMRAHGMTLPPQLEDKR